MHTAYPKCVDCQHYKVTWDPKAPRGCNAHGFKTSGNPEQIVFKESGIPCQLFKLKEVLKKKPG